MKRLLTKPDTADVERRRKAHVEARVLCAFESIAFTPEMEADVERNITGEISDKDFPAYVVRKYGR